MIEPKVKKSRAKIWRLGKDGFVKEDVTLLERIIGTQVVYDRPLVEKDYRARCDVCLAQEQGYACSRIVEAPGPYELEGGCMDCNQLCGRPPIYIGVRNYCSRHMHIMNKKLGVV